MNLNDYKSISIGGHVLKKLVRASDGLVLFDKSAPEPKPYFELTYNGSPSSVFVGSIWAGYYGGEVVVEWGDGTSDTYSVPSGGRSFDIRKNDLYGTRTIRFNSPCVFVTGLSTSRTPLGFEKIRDHGDNLVFANVVGDDLAYHPGLYKCTNLEEMDLSMRTTVPGLTMSGYFDTNTRLARIKIPSSLEQAFRTDTYWQAYQDRFVVV